MNLNKKNSKDYELIARYLAKEMTDQELLRFEERMGSSQENINLINVMKKNWTQIGNYQENKITNADKAWEKLYSKLSSESLIPERHEIEAFRIPLWVKYAASIILLVGLGTASVHYLFNSHKVEMISLNTGNEANTLVQTLADGSVVYLAKNSSFSYPTKFEEGERKVSLEGEAYFDISHKADQPFKIETDNAIVEVLGTAFNIRSQNINQFELTVERGRVKVTLKSNPEQSTIVQAGEKITAADHHLEKTNVNGYHFSWKSQRIKFKDETLENIVRVINKNYSSNIILPSEEIQNKRLTVTFYNNSLSSITDLICISLNLNSEVKPDSTITLTANSE